MARRKSVNDIERQEATLRASTNDPRRRLRVSSIANRYVGNIYDRLGFDLGNDNKRVSRRTYMGLANG